MHPGSLGVFLISIVAFEVSSYATTGRTAHLVAIGAPLDAKQKGLMLYVLRYAEELRDPKSAFAGTKEPRVEADELSLATQLINGSTSPFNSSAYRDDYEAAVKKLVDSKRKGKPLPEAEPPQPKGKVVNIMDALRSSLAKGNKLSKTTGKKPRRKRAA